MNLPDIAFQIGHALAGALLHAFVEVWWAAVALLGLKFGSRWLKRVFFEQAIGGRSALKWYSSRWDKWDTERKRWKK